MFCYIDINYGFAMPAVASPILAPTAATNRYLYIGVFHVYFITNYILLTTFRPRYMYNYVDEIKTIVILIYPASISCLSNLACASSKYRHTLISVAIDWFVNVIDLKYVQHMDLQWSITSKLFYLFILL